MHFIDLVARTKAPFPFQEGVPGTPATYGWPPIIRGTNVVTLAPQRPPQVLDAIPQGTTDQLAVIFMREATPTNASQETAEGNALGAAGGSALSLSQITQSVQVVGTWMPISETQLQDVPAAQSYIDTRLTFLLQQYIDYQVVLGNGTAPNLLGVANVPSINTQARGTDPQFDAILKSLVKCMYTGYSNPTAVILHPTDWQTMRLARTADGLYIMGQPDQAGPSTLWGVPVIVFSGGSAGTSYCGDFATHSMLYIRMGVTLEFGTINTDFTQLQKTVRIYIRASMVWYRPTAFCKITGM
jgi:HK97 family phage major capsid protein